MISSKKCPQKAIIFARVSTVSQAQEGYSLNAQVSRLQEYCKQKNLEVVKEFSIVESSTTRDRKEFLEVMNFIKKQKEPIALVVYSVDRLQRGFKEVIILDELIKFGKVEIHYVQDGFIAHKDMDSSQKLRLNLNILLSRDYSRRISESTKRVIQEKLERGEWIGKAPFGYKNVTLKNGVKDVIIDEETSLIVKEIFDLYLTGNNLIDISEKFCLSRNIIDRIVNNLFYCGKMQVKDKYYKHKYPIIIEKEVFDKCQKVRKTRKNA